MKLYYEDIKGINSFQFEEGDLRKFSKDNEGDVYFIKLEFSRHTGRINFDPGDGKLREMYKKRVEVLRNDLYDRMKHLLLKQSW